MYLNFLNSDKIRRCMILKLFKVTKKTSLKEFNLRTIT